MLSFVELREKVKLAAGEKQVKALKGGKKKNVDIIVTKKSNKFGVYINGEKLDGNYVIYDLGGGTFDVSIISVSGQDIDVLASNGLQELGGDDFDKEIQFVTGDEWKAGNLSYHLNSRPRWEGFTTNKILNNSSQFICVDDVCLGRY